MRERMRIRREEEKETVLPSAQNETPQLSPFASKQDMDEVPSIVQEDLSSTSQTLDDETRAFMEPGFGHDFSKVCIHADEPATQKAPIGPEGGQLDAQLTSRIQAERGSGTPLKVPIREQMEQAFGANFANVRLHADPTSYTFNHSVGARAFTIGNDIFLGPEASPDETQLLAHELTHVVQQRSVSNRGPMVVGPASNSYEREASMMGTAFIANASSTTEDMVDSADGVQRIPIDASLSNGAPGEADATTIPAETASGRGMSTGLLVQRQDNLSQPSLGQRVTDLEKHQRVLEKRQAATDLDLRWRATFGERLASYRQAIFRISGGFNAATQGFQAAQIAQAQTNALATQLAGAALAILFAAGFEWAFAGALGKLGTEAGKIPKIVELGENPANAAVSGGVNVAGVLTSKSSTTQGQTPPTSSVPGLQVPAGAAGGDAMAFLTSNSEAIERHVGLIEQAFINRAAAMQNYTDDQWLQFTPSTEEAKYQQLLDALKNAASGVEQLKPAEAVAQVLERHLWALWITNQADTLLAEQAKEHALGEWEGGGSEENYSVGSDVEVRLNQVGASAKANVQLTGHWYTSNSPGNWRELLLKWARTYDGSIAKDGKD